MFAENSEPSLLEVSLLEKQAPICLRGLELLNYWPKTKNLTSLNILLCIWTFYYKWEVKAPASEPDESPSCRRALHNHCAHLCVTSTQQWQAYGMCSETCPRLKDAGMGGFSISEMSMFLKVCSLLDPCIIPKSYRKRCASGLKPWTSRPLFEI